MRIRPAGTEADDEVISCRESLEKAEQSVFAAEDISKKDSVVASWQIASPSIPMRIESDGRSLCWFLGSGAAGVPKCCDRAEAESGSSFHGVDMRLVR
jgi:hypothetical protein